MSDSADDIAIKRGRSDLISADETVITLRTGAFPARTGGTNNVLIKKNKIKSVVKLPSEVCFSFPGSISSQEVIVGVDMLGFSVFLH